MKLDDWETIAKNLGTIDDLGQESSSSEKAKKAIQILLGEEFLRDAVKYYIECRPGSELLRGVLWQIQPTVSMEECYRIFKEDECIENKISAVELLRVVADKAALKWVPEFLACEYEGVQNWGIGVIDQLVYSELVSVEDISEILAQAMAHKSEYVREKAAYIQSMLEASEERNAILQHHFDQKNA